MKYRRTSRRLSNVPTTSGHRQWQNLHARLRLQTTKITVLEARLCLLEAALQVALVHWAFKFTIFPDDVSPTQH
jgi:hypothetical protein